MITLKTQDILYLFRQCAVLFQNVSMFFLTSYSANMFQHYFSFYVQLFIACQRSPNLHVTVPLVQRLLAWPDAGAWNSMLRAMWRKPC